MAAALDWRQKMAGRWAAAQYEPMSNLRVSGEALPGFRFRPPSAKGVLLWPF